MKAPEKIYLQVCRDCPEVDCRNCKFEYLEDNITWCKDKNFEKDVEYTRTDAFINKALNWMDEHLFFDDKRWLVEEQKSVKEQMMEDFKNDMKE